tara:strand:- start:197 stop:322 length:126 start_codon:yes stop_codon:yes gene_type:complete
MPVYLRKFYLKELVKVKEEEKKIVESHKKQSQPNKPISRFK